MGTSPAPSGNQTPRVDVSVTMRNDSCVGAASLSPIVGFVRFSPDELVRHAQSVGLGPKTAEVLTRRAVVLIDARAAAAASPESTFRDLQSLDRYQYTTPEAERGYKEGLRFLVGPVLETGGLLLRVDDGFSGYCLMYKQAKELGTDGSARADLPDVYRVARERMAWDVLAQDLSNRSGGVGQIAPESLWHLYDFTVDQSTLKASGLGRLVLKLTQERLIAPGEAGVGFINSDNFASMITMAKAGWVMTGVVPEDPYDGKRVPTIITAYIPGAKYRSTGVAIAYDPHVDPVSRLPAAIGEALAAGGSESVVRYNGTTQRFELATQGSATASV